jgi:hypothetical protein
MDVDLHLDLQWIPQEKQRTRDRAVNHKDQTTTRDSVLNLQSNSRSCWISSAWTGSCVRLQIGRISPERGHGKGWMIRPLLLLQDTCQPISIQQSCSQKTLPPAGVGAVGRWARMRGFGHHTLPRAPLSDWLCQHDDSDGSESQQSFNEENFQMHLTKMVWSGTGSVGHKHFCMVMVEGREKKRKHSRVLPNPRAI